MDDWSVRLWRRARQPATRVACFLVSILAPTHCSRGFCCLKTEAKHRGHGEHRGTSSKGYPWKLGDLSVEESIIRIKRCKISLTPCASPADAERSSSFSALASVWLHSPLRSTLDGSSSTGAKACCCFSALSFSP